MLTWWLSGKESTCNAGATGDAGSIPGPGRSPGGGHGNLLQNTQGRKSLVGYSAWDGKELDMTEVTQHAGKHPNYMKNS